ncbi:peptide-methionine (S)-S-oxide reductase MsrA [Labrys wisconsinensis]
MLGLPGAGAARRTMLAGGAALCAASLAALLLHAAPAAAESAVTIPSPAVDEAAHGHVETAVLAGGCFWGVQGVFQHVRGVSAAVSGYAGGAKETAQYETVSGGDTGHAESVKITFDPGQVSYGKLLQVYFSVVHDPTELNRQGPDSGTQYRSAIFPANAEQRRVAESYIAQLNQAGVFSGPIVTRIEPLKGFYAAEAYHQDFLARHPDHPYIMINDLPKVEALKGTFPGLYRDAPVLVAKAGG